MRLLGQFSAFYFLFFYEKILYAQKSNKSAKTTKKHKNATKQSTKRIKRTKIKNALKRYLSGEK